MSAGRKRWALYPPGRVPPGVEVGIDDEGMPDFQVTAVGILCYLAALLCAVLLFAVLLTQLAAACLSGVCLCMQTPTLAHADPEVLCLAICRRSILGHVSIPLNFRRPPRCMQLLKLYPQLPLAC